MSELFRQVKFTEQHSQRLDGKTHDFEKGDTASISDKLARFVVRREEAAEFTGKTHNVNDADGKVIRPSIDEHVREEKSEDDSFDFETYVDEHTANEIIEEVEESDSVTWLENLENHSDYKTVDEAIEERLDELQNNEE